MSIYCAPDVPQATYRDSHGRFAALRYLATFCADVPTHAVFGAIADYVCVPSHPPLPPLSLSPLPLPLARAFCAASASHRIASC